MFGNNTARGKCFWKLFFCLDVHGAYRDFDIALNGYLLTAQHVKVDTQGRLE